MAKKKTSKSKADNTSAQTDDSQSVENQIEDSVEQLDESVSAVAEDAQTIDGVAEEVTPENVEELAETATEEDAPQDEPIVDPADGDAEPVEEPEVTEAAEVEDTEVDPEPEPEPEKPAERRPAPQPVESQSAFIPMLLGGLLAGGIGFGATYYWNSQSAGSDTAAFQNKVTAQLEQNGEAIAGLTETVSNLPEAPDLTELTDEQGNIAASLDSVVDRLNAIETQFTALDQRLTDVEKRPMTEGASDAAIAAYERELQALQDTMAAQRAEIEALAEEARSMEGNAEEMAQATMLRSALTRVQTAMDSGTGFAPALGDLESGGVEIPAALSDVAEDGVMSLAQLQASFPDAARAALAVSRQQAAENGEQSGFSAFLKNQLGTRSLEPREGDDPDAVLSRAEAAAREGRLADTMAEIEALPDAGRAALADWTANVTRRQAAVSAVEALVQELN